MPRPPKNHRTINCSIDAEIADMLEDFCDKTKLRKTAAVELALVEYIKRFNKDGRILERKDDEHERD